MRNTAFNRRKVFKWILIFGCWTLVALFYAFQTLYQNAHANRYPPWQFIFEIRFIYCYLWFALTPVVLWLGVRFPFESGQTFKSLAIHLTASLLLAFIHVALYALSYSLIPETVVPPFPKLYKDFLVSDFTAGFVTYWIILCATYAATYYQAYRERALKAAQLKESLAQAQLQILKLQLQPHFLFNTLNTISELVHEDGEAADKMITRLSGLLRGSLENAGAQEVTLKEEMDFLQKYLDIEQIRYDKRLVVEIDTAPETLAALLPSMLMQPLVENAVRHSIAPRPEGGRIEIRSEREGANLHITVEDDGRILSENGNLNFKEGIGLSNTRARLEALYDKSYNFELQTSSRGGLKVGIKIPFKTVTEEEAK